MRYPASEKLEIIRLVEESSLPVRRTLEKIGIPHATFYRWYDLYQTGGPEALADRRPKPDRVWNRIPDDVREHIIALEARGRGIVGLTLRYPYEVRDEKPYFEEIHDLKLPKDMLDLATHIVQTKSGRFDPAQFEDRYENALIDLLKKKEAGEKIEPAKEGPTPQVVNLMDALRASIDAEKKKAPAPSTQARRPAKKRASHK